MRFFLSFSLLLLFFFNTTDYKLSRGELAAFPFSPFGQTYFLCERHFLRGGVEQTAACSPLCRFVPRSAAADPAGTARSCGEASPHTHLPEGSRAEQSRERAGGRARTLGAPRRCGDALARAAAPLMVGA